ncbi:MAG: multidrug effflux MFS transporter [Pseudomonadota bacterium]
MTDPAQIRFLDNRTPPHIVTLVAIAGLAAATMNIYLPSLPDITAHFETDYRLVQLSVPLYLAASAVMQLAIGPISDRFGRRPVLLWSFAIFAVFTVAILIAPGPWTFLFCRVGQAVVVSGMVLSRAIVRDIYPQDKAASMIGYVTMGMALVPMIAPLIGGVLAELFGWESNFWFLLLLGALVSWVVWRDLGETAAARDGSLTQQFREAPELLTSRRFWGYNIAMACSSGAFFAYLGGAPFVGSEVFSLSPGMLGLLFGAPAIGYLAGNAASGLYSARFGINRMILVGAMIGICGPGLSLTLFFVGHETALVFFGLMTFVGLGNGLVIPNATAGMLSVRPHLAGTASGLGGAMMVGGGAALSALAGALMVPGAGAYPLLFVMMTTSACALTSIVYVILRERQLRAI